MVCRIRILNEKYTFHIVDDYYFYEDTQVLYEKEGIKYDNMGNWIYADKVINSRLTKHVLFPVRTGVLSPRLNLRF